MAIYHFTAKIVKASSGKCAVASSAYISGSTLYDERLGMTFSYKSKEEVVHSEILLPKNAPPEYQDRSVLWNEVEKAQNKSNSRYARTFEFAVPNEWTRQEAIERSREFIQKNFVDVGMASDFAYHEKDGNHHIHCMCTIRGFKADGSWASMEKKTYALDKDGNRIPEIDPRTGKQKVKVRPGKGEEKIWKRITVQSNNWNKRSQLLQWRKNWSEFCNQYLDKDNQIDHRSYEEQGVDKIPTIHEGYAARKLEASGLVSERCEINREVREVNSMLDKLKEDFRKVANEILRKAGDLIERITRSSSTYETAVTAVGTDRTSTDNHREIGNREQITDLPTLISYSQRVIERTKEYIKEKIKNSVERIITRTEDTDSGERYRDAERREPNASRGYPDANRSLGVPVTAQEDEVDRIRELSVEGCGISIDEELRKVNNRVEELTRKFGGKGEGTGQDNQREDNSSRERSETAPGKPAHNNERIPVKRNRKPYRRS